MVGAVKLTVAVVAVEEVAVIPVGAPGATVTAKLIPPERVTPENENGIKDYPLHIVN